MRDILSAQCLQGSQRWHDLCLCPCARLFIPMTSRCRDTQESAKNESTVFTAKFNINDDPSRIRRGMLAWRLKYNLWRLKSATYSNVNNWRTLLNKQTGRWVWISHYHIAWYHHILAMGGGKYGTRVRTDLSKLSEVSCHFCNKAHPSLGLPQQTVCSQSTTSHRLLDISACIPLPSCCLT